jgi:hypothetical protein
MTEGLALLRQPFPANQISKLCRPTKKENPKGSCKVCGGYHGLPAISLDYVGHAALTDRLLDADPMWTWEPLALTPEGLPALDPLGGMWIKLTVCGVTRLGYGHAGTKEGGDAIKEVIGDALRNAAMRFGAALDLWHKGDLHAEEKKPTERHRAIEPVVEMIPKDELAELREMAYQVKHSMSNPAGGGPGPTLDFIKAQNLTQEQYVGLWSFLPSDIRAALKKESLRRDQPKAA